MKKLPTSILIVVVFILTLNLSFSQNSDNWLEKNDLVHYRKLYLHTDRELYFLEDTIRFKAYYLNGQSQQFISGSYNLYVSLINAEGELVHNEVIPISKGIGLGNISISDTIQDGNYVLRAYTEFQKNIGEDTYFYKKLKISKVENSLHVNDIPENLIHNTEKIDVAFLPEGGFLLENELNNVGFKVLNENGQGIPVEGEIINSKGELVTLFSTSFKGMGRLYFKPLSNEKYIVKIKNHPNFEYEFDNIKKSAIKIELKGKKDDDLLIHVLSNTDLFEGKEFYIAALCRGKVLFHKKFIHNNRISQIRLNQNILLQGINKFVLLDNELKPISERLYFSKNLNTNDIKVNISNDQFTTRTAVDIELLDSKKLYEGEFSNLSISIIDNNSISGSAPSVNILSSLLINSELKGNIETPNDFFTNDNDLSSEYKLNLLMLTQGWSQYIWDFIPEFAEDDISAKHEFITIKGNINRLVTKGPVADGKVLLGLFKDEGQNFYEGKTDDHGRFSFDNIYFTDSIFVFIQAENKKGRLLTDIYLDPVFNYQSSISKLYLPGKNILSTTPLKIYEQKYYNDLKLQEYDPNLKVINLEEIVVSGKKNERDDGHFSIYGKANTSFKITDDDIIYRNLFEYLAGRVSGVQVSPSGKKITIRGRSSIYGNGNPLILLDNSPIDIENIDNIPMSDIDKVDVLKNAAEIAIFGMRGANGVISIYTKNGRNIDYNDPVTKGTLAEKLKGYAAYKEFYSPKYNQKNINTEKPDHRITLYWNPNVITENGKALLSFYTSDDISNYKVFVEGITTEGKICIGSADFMVVQ